MANINWSEPFFFTVSLGPVAASIPVPTYGNFGGPGFTNGIFTGSTATPDPVPVDDLDEVFAVHDAATGDPATPQLVDDIALLQAIVALKPGQMDEEASVYAGATTLAYLGLLAGSGDLDAFSEKQVAAATRDAVQNIRRGFNQWDPDEVEQAQDWLGSVQTALGGASFDSALDAFGIESFSIHGRQADWLL